MKIGLGRALIAAIMIAAAMPVPAYAACKALVTAADLDLMRGKLDGHFCLSSDIDLGTAGNFKPIGDELHPFTGVLDGNGHALRGLTVSSGGLRAVGLFGWIDGGTVRNLRLPGIVIRSTLDHALVGAVAGMIIGRASVANVRVSGQVKCTGQLCRVGGIAGEHDNGTIHDVAVAATIIGGDGGAAGGLVGETDGLIYRSYATGPVSCGSNCAAGGLVGFAGADTKIKVSFSAAPLRSGGAGSAGGLIGTGYGSVAQSYTSGPVQTSGNAIVASGVGYFAGVLAQDFAIGRVRPGAESTSGGLVGVLAGTPARAAHSYWDLDLTGKSTSIKGQGLTDAQMQANLPSGFTAPWDITKGYSYPFLNLAELPYVSTLATLTQSGKVFTFLPIEQLEPSEYQTPANFAARAALAAVYAMIARAVGYTDDVDALKTTRIDAFWDDATGKAIWTGPVTTHATLGSLKALGAGTPIGDGNIIGALKTKHVVIIRGHYDLSGGRTAPHWMLATLFTANSGNVTTNLVANDPWTGTQVWIDLGTHKVVRPADFPLANFAVDAYQVVTLN